MFPWNGSNPITDLTDPNGPTIIQEGHTYRLNNVNGTGGFNIVKAINVTATSFSFQIISADSFEPEGGIITFSAKWIGDQAYLTVEANTPFMWWHGIPIDYAMPVIASDVWAQLARRLYEHFVANPQPPMGTIGFS